MSQVVAAGNHKERRAMPRFRFQVAVESAPEILRDPRVRTEADKLLSSSSANADRFLPLQTFGHVPIVER